MKGKQGFTLVELIVALAAALVAVGVLAELVAGARTIGQALPEANDMEQRVRAATAAVASLVGRAGAGANGDRWAAEVARSLPPVFPHRRAPTGADGELSAYTDRLSIVRVVDSAAASRLAGPMSSPASTIRVTVAGGCVGAPACRFALGDRGVVADDTGTFDWFIVTGIGPDTVDHAPALLVKPFDPADDARVAPVRVEALAWDSAASVLRSYVDASGGQPIVDDVVGFAIRYFGDVAPPIRPAPVPGRPGCLVDAAGQPTLPSLGPTNGALAELTPATLSDGPACGAVPQRFDADLYRIRRLSITLRVQASSPSRRGRDPRRWVHPGVADDKEAWPDVELTFDVTLGGRRL